MAGLLTLWKMVEEDRCVCVCVSEGYLCVKKLFREKREFNGCEVLQIASNHISEKGNLGAR